MNTRKLVKTFFDKQVEAIAKHHNRHNDDKDDIHIAGEIWFKEVISGTIMAYFRTYDNGSLQQDSSILVLTYNEKKDSLVKSAVIDLEDVDMVKYTRGFRFLESEFQIQYYV